MKDKLTRIGLAVVLALGLGLTACDREDEADVREGVNQVEEGAEDVGNEIEQEVDDNVDTDGNDDK